MKKLLYLIMLITVFNVAVEAAEVKKFNAGSYVQILENHRDTPFILTIWSVYCSSCLKDMALLQEIHQREPGIKMVMLSVDDFSEMDKVKGILARFKLESLENWLFSEGNAQKLRYQIDPGWYGELPRTYYYTADHQREALSGALRRKDYAEILATISK